MGIAVRSGTNRPAAAAWDRRMGGSEVWGAGEVANAIFECPEILCSLLNDVPLSGSQPVVSSPDQCDSFGSGT